MKGTKNHSMRKTVNVLVEKKIMTQESSHAFKCCCCPLDHVGFSSVTQVLLCHFFPSYHLPGLQEFKSNRVKALS